MPEYARRPAGDQAFKTVFLAVLACMLLAGAAMAAAIVYSTVASRSAQKPVQRQAAPAPAVPPPVYTPSAAVTRPLPMPPQGRQASSRRATDSHFYFDTVLNGMTVKMMFDTGAGMVALRSEDAARAGIAIGGLTYNLRIGTANGMSEAALVTLDSLRVGDITRFNVPAQVLRPGKLGISLLGGSFVTRINGYRFDGSELILQGD